MNESGEPFVAVVRDGLFLGLITELELVTVAERMAKAGFQRNDATLAPEVSLEVGKRSNW